MGFLGAIEWLQQRKLAGLGLGLAALAMSVIGTDDSVRGIGGEAKILSSIAAETARMLRSPLFASPR